MTLKHLKSRFKCNNLKCGNHYVLHYNILNSLFKLPVTSKVLQIFIILAFKCGVSSNVYFITRDSDCFFWMKNTFSFWWKWVAFRNLNTMKFLIFQVFLHCIWHIFIAFLGKIVIQPLRHMQQILPVIRYINSFSDFSYPLLTLWFTLVFQSISNNDMKWNKTLDWIGRKTTDELNFQDII